MRSTSSFAFLIFIIIVAIGGGVAFAANTPASHTLSIGVGGTAFLLAGLACLSIRVADQWDNAVIVRLGKFHSPKGPGLFFIIPVIDAIPYWIDTRVITTSFKAEKTLTKDTVPVGVDAVLFWKVTDPKKAALGVADYQSAISWASQNRLTYRRTNCNLNVRGYIVEGTISTAFDIRVQNDLDRFHLVQDVVDRVHGLKSKGAYFTQMVENKLIQHKLYIDKHGEDLPEIRVWKWQVSK